MRPLAGTSPLLSPRRQRATFVNDFNRKERKEREENAAEKHQALSRGKPADQLLGFDLFSLLRRIQRPHRFRHSHRIKNFINLFFAQQFLLARNFDNRPARCYSLFRDFRRFCVSNIWIERGRQ